MALLDALKTGKIPHWDDAPDEWDRLKLGPYVLPGVWDIRFTVRRVLDIKKPRGNDGSRIKDEGYESPVIEMTGKIATREQWIEIQEILPKFHPKKKGEKRDVYGIEHPKAQLLGITTVYIKQIDTALGNGIFTIKMDAIEWVPAPKAVKPNPKPPVKGYNPLDQDKDLSGVPNGIAADKGP